jgi:hypothetical protein
MKPLFWVRNLLNIAFIEPALIGKKGYTVPTQKGFETLFGFVVKTGIYMW